MSNLFLVNHPFGSDVALEVLNLMQSHTGIRQHADDQLCSLFAGRGQLVVLILMHEGGIVKVEDHADVMLVRWELLVLKTLEVQYP